MLPRGRPPGPGTAEEKAAIRREKVRLNVKAHRERKKNALTASSQPASSSQRSSTQVTPEPNSDADKDVEKQQYQSDIHDGYGQVVVRSRTQPVLDSQLACFKSKTKATKQAAAQWYAPDSGPMLSIALLSVFRNQFLPRNVNLPTKPEVQEGSHLVTPCSPWIMNAYNMALQQDGSALKSGLLAVGLILNGLENSSSKLKVASIQMHQQALRKLQHDLKPIALRRHRNLSATNIIAPYLSCLAVAMFELVQHGFSPVIIQHVKALNSLIELMHADPSLDTFTANLIMEDFGMLEMMFCLKYGFGSVLKDTRRKLGLRRVNNVTKPEPRQNASVYGDMLDIVQELPSLISRVRELQSRVGSHEHCEELRSINNMLLRIQEDLDAWKINFELNHGSILVQESFSDEVSGKRGTRARLSSYEHGAVGLFTLYFQLNVIDTTIDATLLTAQIQEWLATQASTLSGQEISRPDHQADYATLPASYTQKLSFAAPGTSQLHNRDSALYEQLKAQRKKGQVVIKQLLEAIRLFSKLSLNVSGRSLLVNPCDLIRELLDKEQTRLNEDLRQLQHGDLQEAAEIDKFLSNLAEAKRILQDVECEALQRNFDSI